MSLSKLLSSKGPLLSVEKAFEIFQQQEKPSEVKGIERIRFLDCTWTLVSYDDAKRLFEEEHIPRSKWFEIDTICQQNTDLPHMFPDSSLFVEWMKKLKVNNDSILILYDRLPIPSAARVWWTFKTFGHEEVYIINGGLHQWKQRNYPTSKSYPDINNVESKEESKEFQIKLIKEKIHSFEDIQRRFVNAIKPDHNSLLIDARPSGRFNGSVPEPRPGVRSGHIPGAINIPFLDVFDIQTGYYKSNPEITSMINDLLNEKNKSTKEVKELVLYCGSGITACALEVGLSASGIQNSYHSKPHDNQEGGDNEQIMKISLYDGSWTEYDQKTK